MVFQDRELKTGNSQVSTESLMQEVLSFEFTLGVSKWVLILPYNVIKGRQMGYIWKCAKY